jgi:hypothetical protein
MRKPNRNEQVLLVVLAGVAGAWFFAKKVHAPVEAEIATLETSYKDMLAKRTDLESRPVETATVKKRIATLQVEHDIAKAAFDSLAARRLAPRDRIQETLLEFTSLASENSLQVSEALRDSSGDSTANRPKAKKKSKPVAKDSAAADSLRMAGSAKQRRWAKSLGLVRYRFKLKGDYLDLVAFVSDLAESERLSLPTDLRVQNVDEQGIVTAQCTLSF